MNSIAIASTVRGNPYGTAFRPVMHSYDERDVILHALGAAALAPVPTNDERLL